MPIFMLVNPCPNFLALCNCSFQSIMALYMAKIIIQFSRHDGVYKLVFFDVQIFRVSIFLSLMVDYILSIFYKHFSSKVHIFFFNDFEIVHDSHSYVAIGKIHTVKMLISLLMLNHNLVWCLIFALLWPFFC